MLQDLIENNVIVELKFVDETIKEMLNKNNTKIYNINIKKTSYDFDHFLNIAGILSFINIIRVQREPVNANVIHTSTISFIGMLLNIHTNVVDLTQELSNKKYYQIDAYKASGAGGQHVNKTNSAVRITHTLLNIVVTSQAERSFIQNKAHAEKVLIQQIKYSFAYALTSILNNSLGNINTNRNAKDVTFNYKRNIFTLHNEYKYNFSINCLKNKNYGQFLLNSIIK
ncbi:Peptide chain release factor 1 [bacterium AB1]|nr:Peptide chain release factor 1 [bacterium AB1]